MKTLLITNMNADSISEEMLIDSLIQSGISYDLPNFFLGMNDSNKSKLFTDDIFDVLVSASEAAYLFNDFMVADVLQTEYQRLQVVEKLRASMIFYMKAPHLTDKVILKALSINSDVIEYITNERVTEDLKKEISRIIPDPIFNALIQRKYERRFSDPMGG